MILIKMIVLLLALCIQPISASKTWQALQKGNENFIINKTFTKQRDKTAAAQNPTAIILSCADSRVPAELIFNQGVGQMFTVRVAGQVVDDVVIDTIEFAVKTFNPKILIVMGHSNCGAVDGALGRLRKNKGKIIKPTKPHLDAVLIPIEHAIKNSKIDINAPDALELATNANVCYIVKQLIANSKTIANAVKNKKLEIIHAHYDLQSGKVTKIKC